jgi:hypothetical protein
MNININRQYQKVLRGEKLEVPADWVDIIDWATEDATKILHVAMHMAYQKGLNDAAKRASNERDSH